MEGLWILGERRVGELQCLACVKKSQYFLSLNLWFIEKHLVHQNKQYHLEVLLGIFYMNSHT